MGHPIPERTGPPSRSYQWSKILFNTQGEYSSPPVRLGEYGKKIPLTCAECERAFLFLNGEGLLVACKPLSINVVRDRTPGEQLAHLIAFLEQVNWKTECEWEGPGLCKV